MHVLGIDAGGTKTICYLADADGEIVGEGKGGGANLQAHGELQVEKVLHGVIDQAIAERDITPAAVCLGVAGVDRPEDDRVVRSLMRRLGFKSHLLVVNDALVALVAGVGSEPGVVLIAGTGSIAYGVNPAGFAARAGGWGFVLGDEGSGYWIGRQALAAVVREADGRGAPTQLTALVLDHFQLARVDGLVREVYDRGLNRHAIAAIAGLVGKAREAGDVTSAEILARAGDELTRAVTSVVTRLEMRGLAFGTVLSGGMFRAIPLLAADMTQRLAEVAPRSQVHTLAVEPAMGAVHLALLEARHGFTLPRYVEGVVT